MAGLGVVLQLFYVCLISSLAAGDTIYVTYDSQQHTYTILNTSTAPSKWAALANFTDEISSTGWAHLEVTTSKSLDDEVQAYAGGLAEGYATSTLIYYYWYNTVSGYCDGEESYCRDLNNFISANLDWMEDKIKSAQGKVPYWHQVDLLLTQMQGVEDGYKQVGSKLKRRLKLRPGVNLDPMGILILNLFGDLEDLGVVLNKTVSPKLKGTGSCSALIKPLADYSDLYTSHVSWNGYNAMLRLLKKYSFNFKYSTDEGSPKIPGNTMAFSSYPGTIFSGDDFHIISSGLLSVETTIGNANASLWKFVTPQTMMEFMRTQVANRLADTGAVWMETFTMYNSGTYNNQWMIVDYNKFNPGTTTLPNGLLNILEQLPGYVESGDQTEVLRNQGYWPSYNCPFYPKIFNLSGATYDVANYGDWFTYDKTPRALMFKRGQGNVVDVDSMIKLMRYNDYTHDPLARCNCTPPYSGENAISARSDLNPQRGVYPFGALGSRAHGGIDMKLTTYEGFWRYEIIAISGPTYDQVPVFQWSTSPFDKTVSHMGQPDVWKFQRVKTIWS